MRKAVRSIVAGSPNSAVKRITGPRANGLESEPVLSTSPEVQIQKHDFIVRDEGTIWLFTPQSESASEFLRDHIEDEAQYFGTSLVVSHNYVDGLLVGLKEHGLSAVIG
jgi:hypothetical protein